MNQNSSYLNKAGKLLMLLFILAVSPKAFAQKFKSELALNLGFGNSSFNDEFDKKYNSISQKNNLNIQYNAHFRRWRNYGRGSIFGFGLKVGTFRKDFLREYPMGARPVANPPGAENFQVLTTSYVTQFTALMLPIQYGRYTTTRNNMRLYFIISAIPAIVINNDYRGAYVNGQGDPYTVFLNNYDADKKIYDLKTGLGQLDLGVQFSINKRSYLDFSVYYMQSINSVVNYDATISEPTDGFNNKIKFKFWEANGVNSAEIPNYYEAQGNIYEYTGRSYNQYLTSIGLNLGLNWKLVD